MLAKTISSYGGAYQNARPVRDPTTQVDAAKFNRLAEDAAQMTRTAIRATVSFVTATSGSTIDPANVTHFSVWGSSSAQKPVVARAGTGEYTVTWEEEFAAALVTVANTDSAEETESGVCTMPVGQPNVMGATIGWARVVSIASNVVTVAVYDDAAPAALSDLGGTATVSFSVR